jgi:hypothetical protein
LDEDEQWPHLSILGKVRQLFSAIADDPRRNLFQQIKVRYTVYLGLMILNISQRRKLL